MLEFRRSDRISIGKKSEGRRAEFLLHPFSLILCLFSLLPFLVCLLYHAGFRHSMREASPDSLIPIDYLDSSPKIGRMAVRIDKALIAKRLDRIERELLDLRRQLRPIPRSRATQGRKRPFAELYGAWKGIGDLTPEEIKKHQYHIPDDILCP